MPASDARRRVAVYDALLAATADATWTVPIDGVQREPQPRWQAYTGQSSTEVVGHGWLDAVHPDDREGTKEHWSKALETGTMFDAEFRVRRHDGEYRWMRARGVPILDDAGAVSEFVCLSTDITEERARLVSAQLREAHAHRLLGIVGHDLRNPLNTIAISAQVLRHLHVTPAEQVAQMLDNVERATRRASELIATILDYAGAALGGGLQIHPTALDLHATVQECVADMRAQHPGRRISVHAESRDVEAGAFAGRWDGARLQQVLVNLLTNAIAHGTRGGAVEVTLHAADDRVYLDISNASETLSPAQLATLFDPAVSRSAGTSTSSGLGLGLYIVQQLVQAHGGRVWATSVQACTTLHLELPRTPARNAKAFDAVTTSPGTSAGITTMDRAPGAAAGGWHAIPPYAWRIQHAPVRGLLFAWLNASAPAALPSCDDVLRGEVRGWSHDMCRVAAERLGPPGEWHFHFADVGAALERRIGMPLAGLDVRADAECTSPELRQWLEDYVRAAETGMPAYTYFTVHDDPTREATPSGGIGRERPLLIERLVVPCSDHRSPSVTHLLSIVRFRGCDEPARPIAVAVPRPS